MLWTPAGASRGGVVRAVVLNSGGANACTGPAGFQDTHATAEHVAGALTAADRGAGDVAVCSTGLIGERLPMDKLLPGVDAARARRCPATAAPAAAEAIMTTDTGAEDRRRRRAAAGPSAAWPRAPACSRPAWPPCSCVLTTDAVADAGDARRARCARRPGSPSTGSTPTAACPPTTPCCCWPAARPASTPTPDELTAAVTAACTRPGPAAARRRRGRTKEIAIEVRRRGDRGRRGRGRPRGRPQQPGQVRVLRQRPELGPDPGRGRHHRARRSSPTGSTSRSTGSGSAAAGAAGEDRVQGRPDRPRRCTITVDLHAGTDDRDDLDQRPVARLRARELGVLDMSTVDRTRRPRPIALGQGEPR